MDQTLLILLTGSYKRTVAKKYDEKSPSVICKSETLFMPYQNTKAIPHAPINPVVGEMADSIVMAFFSVEKSFEFKSLKPLSLIFSRLYAWTNFMLCRVSWTKPDRSPILSCPLRLNFLNFFARLNTGNTKSGITITVMSVSDQFMHKSQPNKKTVFAVSLKIVVRVSATHD